MLSTDYLQQHLGTGGLGEDDLAVIALLEEAQLAFVESATGRTFREAADLVEVYDGTDEIRLELRTAVADDEVESSVAVEFPNGAAGWYSPFTAPLPFRIQTHPRLGVRNLLVLTGGLKWPRGFNNVRIGYPGGYEEGSEPAEIRALVADLTCWRFRARTVATSASATSEQPDGIPAHLQATIDKWRLIQREPQPRLCRVA